MDNVYPSGECWSEESLWQYYYNVKAEKKIFLHRIGNKSEYSFVLVLMGDGWAWPVLRRSLLLWGGEILQLECNQRWGRVRDPAIQSSRIWLSGCSGAIVGLILGIPPILSALHTFCSTAPSPDEDLWTPRNVLLFFLKHRSLNKIKSGLYKFCFWVFPPCTTSAWAAWWGCLDNKEQLTELQIVVGVSGGISIPIAGVSGRNSVSEKNGSSLLVSVGGIFSRRTEKSKQKTGFSHSLETTVLENPSRLDNSRKVRTLMG